MQEKREKKKKENDKKTRLTWNTSRTANGCEEESDKRDVREDYTPASLDPRASRETRFLSGLRLSRRKKLLSLLNYYDLRIGRRGVIARAHLAIISLSLSFFLVLSRSRSLSLVSTLSRLLVMCYVPCIAECRLCGGGGLPPASTLLPLWLSS